MTQDRRETCWPGRTAAHPQYRSSTVMSGSDAVSSSPLSGRHDCSVNRGIVLMLLVLNNESIFLNSLGKQKPIPELGKGDLKGQCPPEMIIYLKVKLHHSICGLHLFLGTLEHPTDTRRFPPGWIGRTGSVNDRCGTSSSVQSSIHSWEKCIEHCLSPFRLL